MLSSAKRTTSGNDEQLAALSEATRRNHVDVVALLTAALKGKPLPTAEALSRLVQVERAKQMAEMDWEIFSQIFTSYIDSLQINPPSTGTIDSVHRLFSLRILHQGASQ